MVTLRRKAKVPTEAPAADPQPAASPRKSRRAAPRSQATTTTTTTTTPPPPSNEEDQLWAEKYRAMIREERAAANRNTFSRLQHKIMLTWHHFRISMVPFMLDPWEQALYILGIVVMLWGLVHTCQQAWTSTRP